MAQKLQASLAEVTGLRDRKIRQRKDLAMLKFDGTAVLIELGVVANDKDREALLNAQLRDAVTHTIAGVCVDHLARV